MIYCLRQGNVVYYSDRKMDITYYQNESGAGGTYFEAKNLETLKRRNPHNAIQHINNNILGAAYGDLGGGV